MAIRTHQSISGFVASDPQLSYTERGDARLYMKVGIEHYRKEPDNTFTQLETTFHDLIAYRGAAEQGAERLRQGRQHHRRRTGARLLLRARRPAVRGRGVHRDAHRSRPGPDPLRGGPQRTHFRPRRHGVRCPQQGAPSNATAIGM